MNIGDIVEGKITCITKFGAFMSFAEGKNGLIHISELADKYVVKVEDCIKIGDEVKAKIINISNDGKISLSIKQALEAKQGFEHEKREKKEYNDHRDYKNSRENKAQPKEMTFEDMMSKFLKDSQDRYVDIKNRDNKKINNRARGAK